MSFSLELKDKIEQASNDLRKKTKEEKLQFLIRAGIVDEKGKLKKRFRTSVKTSSSPRQNKKAS